MLRTRFLKSSSYKFTSLRNAKRAFTLRLITLHKASIQLNSGEYPGMNMSSIFELSQYCLTSFPMWALALSRTMYNFVSFVNHEVYLTFLKNWSTSSFFVLFPIMNTGFESDELIAPNTVKPGILLSLIIILTGHSRDVHVLLFLIHTLKDASSKYNTGASCFIKAASRIVKEWIAWTSTLKPCWYI